MGVPRRWGLPLVPAVAILLALLVLCEALATVAARDGRAWADTIYWLSLGSMVMIVAGAQLMPRLSARERLGLVLLLGLALYCVKVLANPVGLTYFDELSHVRTAADIDSSGHLLHSNPLLEISPYFPGLEIVAVSLSKLAGISLFASAVTVIGVSRLVLVASLFAIFSEASRSHRVAGLATVVYMANPTFLYFDAGFSYESLALPLCVAALALTIRWMAEPPGRRSLALLACIAAIVAGLIPTHHLSTYLFGALAVGLWICAILGRRWGGTSRPPWPIALFAIAGAVAWAVTVATPVYDYLEPILRPAVEGVANVATGGESAHKAFSAVHAPEASAATWLRVTAFASILLTLACLPFGWLLAWGRRSNPAALLLGAISLLYLPALVLRISGAGVESANRSSGFVYLGVALMLALLIEHLIDHQALPTLEWKRLRLAIGLPAGWLSGRGATIGVLATVLILFVGGVTIFWPPYSRLPGPYLAGTDLRAVSADGIAASKWMNRDLGPGHRVLTDRTNGQLAGAYGEQSPVKGKVGDLSISLPMTSTKLTPRGLKVLRDKGVEFIVVDTRLSDSIPIRGWYFSSSELYAKPYTAPIPLEKLIKFGQIAGVDLIYDNGAIRVYDVRRLTGR